LSIINFTVKYDMYGSGVDTEVPLVGTVTFAPRTTNDMPVMAPEYTPPTGFKLLSFGGYIEGGRLKSGPGGSDGVRLWAHDPVLEIDKLTYEVSFDLHTVHGQPVAVDGGYFEAPQTDIVVQLAEVLQSTTFVGGPRIIGGEFVGNTVIFENLGGTKLSPITVPNGVLVFVDNGDATWSVGS
jgi:hypothetical protein